MNLQIETITVANGGRMDVIRDIEKVRKLLSAAESLANRLRLWSLPTGEMLCSGDAEALAEWEAL